MLLKSLRVKNFRVHTDTFLEFSEKLNFLSGGNGQGKTTIIEAIYFLCTTKNFKSASDAELLQFGKDEYEIGGLFKSLTDNKASIYYSLNENKRAYVQDGKQVSRTSEIVGKFPVVLLTPDDSSLTHGYPADRRKFVDAILSQASELYLNTLLDYNKTLRHRASLLNKLNENRRVDYLEELEAWNSKLVQEGTSLIKYRKKFVEQFNSHLLSAYYEIMQNEEIPDIEYQNFANGSDEIESVFSSLLEERKDEEILRGSNLTGPHRDEFVFKVNDKNLKTFGSQGQHKTFQVALRFAQFFYLKERFYKTAVFLLDDVFGELDKSRAERISRYLRQVGQVFITITDFSNLSFLTTNPDDLVINIKDGTAVYA